MANKHFFANHLLFTGGEGDEVTSSSFVARKIAIHTSRLLLEVLIARLLPTSGAAKETTFPTTIKLLIAFRSLLACANGEWVTLPSYASIGFYNVLL